MELFPNNSVPLSIVPLLLHPAPESYHHCHPSTILSKIIAIVVKYEKIPKITFM